MAGYPYQMPMASGCASDFHSTFTPVHSTFTLFSLYFHSLSLHRHPTYTTKSKTDPIRHGDRMLPTLPKFQSATYLTELAIRFKREQMYTILSGRKSRPLWESLPSSLRQGTALADRSTPAVYMFHARRLYVPRPPSICSTAVERSKLKPQGEQSVAETMTE